VPEGDRVVRGSSAFERLVRVVTRATQVAIVVTGAILVILVAGEVFSRYVLQRSLFFAEELSRSLFIWGSFLGASLALRRRQHVGLELGRIGRLRAVRLLIHALILVFLVAFLISSLDLLPAMWQRQTTTLEVSVFWVFLALPVGALLMILQLAALAIAGPTDDHSLDGDVDGEAPTRAL